MLPVRISGPGFVSWHQLAFSHSTIGCLEGLSCIAEPKQLGNLGIITCQVGEDCRSELGGLEPEVFDAG